MAYLSFGDELELLLELVKFKGFVRYSGVLYAEHCGEFRPECTIAELVWGWCRNPCYALRLIEEVTASIPDYLKILGNSHRDMSLPLICGNVSEAVDLMDRTNSDITYSIGEHPYDHCYEDIESGERFQVINCSDQEGHFWNGLLIPSEKWVGGVKSIKIEIIDQADFVHLFSTTFTSAEVAKRIRRRNDVIMFQPFRHPMPLQSLGIEVHISIDYCGNEIGHAEPLFSVASLRFMEWFNLVAIEVRLLKNTVALINMREQSIEIK